MLHLASTKVNCAIALFSYVQLPISQPERTRVNHRVDKHRTMELSSKMNENMRVYSMSLSLPGCSENRTPPPLLLSTVIPHPFFLF